MLNNKNFSSTPNMVINALDFEPIRLALKDDEASKDWDEEYLDRVEELYRSYLYLCYKYPQEKLVPTKEIDIFWHNHILNTKKYYDDCIQIFGKILHHCPTSGLKDETREQQMKYYQRTLELAQYEFSHLC